MISTERDIFSKPHKVASWQESYWQKFLSIGLPTKYFESFHYFPVLKFHEYCKQVEEAKVIISEQELKMIRERKGSLPYFLFQDGIFRSDLSSFAALPSKVQVMTLNEALKSSYASFLEHRLHILLKQEEDPLALLNGACCREGLFVYVPPKTHIQLPIEIVCIQTDPKVIHTTPRVHIFVGAEAKVDLITSSEGGALYNGFLDIALEEKASLSHMTYCGEQREDFGFFTVRSSLKKKSIFQSMICTYAASCRRENYRISLLGECAQAHLKGLAILAHSDQLHTQIRVDHKAPRCVSQQKFKQVLTAQSRSSFTGKIFIESQAEQTEAYQLSRSLLLSDEAMAYAKPNLEIFADDVKASHGATISQIDEEQRMYLQSRGIPFSMAGALLTQGFCQEILQEIPFEFFRTQCEEKCKHLLFDVR